MRLRDPSRKYREGGIARRTGWQSMVTQGKPVTDADADRLQGEPMRASSKSATTNVFVRTALRSASALAMSFAMTAMSQPIISGPTLHVGEVVEIDSSVSLGARGWTEASSGWSRRPEGT
jgi:hypothetical protein